MTLREGAPGTGPCSAPVPSLRAETASPVNAARVTSRAAVALLVAVQPPSPPMLRRDETVTVIRSPPDDTVTVAPAGAADLAKPRATASGSERANERAANLAASTHRIWSRPTAITASP